MVTTMESSRQTDGSIEATLRSALLDILTEENFRHAPPPLKKKWPFIHSFGEPREKRDTVSFRMIRFPISRLISSN